MEALFPIRENASRQLPFGFFSLECINFKCTKSPNNA